LSNPILSNPDVGASRPLRRHLVKRFHAVPASDQCYGLAEGPVWDGDRDRVLWVDINAGAVHSGTLSAHGVTHETVLRLPGTVGAVVSSRKGNLLVAGARRLYNVSSEGAVSLGPQILSEHTASRLNDGGCDPAGHFLVGSVALDDRGHQEVLVRIDDDGRTFVIDDDLGLSNGVAFSSEGDLLYNVDTTPGIVWIRDYDTRTGAIGHRREFLHLAGGSPDGMCADAQGNLWIAIWGAGQVQCYSPSGEPLAIVDVAAPNTTSVAFVGTSLETLLITTASEQLSAAQRARFPDSGRLFIAHVGVSGLPVPPWAGTRSAPERPATTMSADSR
jgi:sugar lactone lactonase YvrE